MTEKLNTSDCDQCSKAGRKGRLKICQINFNEAVIICTNALCSFGLESGETLSRSLSAINLKGKSKDGLCTASQSICTSHTKSRLPSAGSISATGPFIQSSKHSLSVSSTTWRSLHAGLPGVKNLGKDQIIQNFLYQLPLSGKVSCNAGKDLGGSSTATESLCDQENTNSLSATKTFTKLKLKRGFEGFQFNKKDKTFADEDKKKQTEICVNKNTSENKAFSDQPYSVNQNEKIKTSSSQNSRSSEFSAIKNTSYSKHIPDSKDVFINSTPSCITKNIFAQSDHIPENSNEWKWESFLQWQNKDALCWLDVVLCLLVHNQGLVNLLKDNRCPKESIIFTLLKAYHQAQDLINGKKKCLQRNSPDSDFVQSVLSNTHSKSEIACSKGHGQTCSSGLTDTSIQTGAGNSPSSLGMLGESLYECPGLAVACKTMEDVREAVWQRLQSKLKCEKGRNDSPVLAFSALVQETLEVKAQFQMRYRFSYTCLGCGEVEESIHENILPSFPNTSVDFSIEKPAHIRKCMKCRQESSRVMTYERLPNTLLMHFAEGLPHNRLTALDLQFQGDYYEVKGVIRYTNNPDHFTAWIRNGTDDTWMECDDLKSPVCRFLPEAPNFPPQEIHIVMWEKRARQGGNASELGSQNPSACQSTNARTQLDCQFTNLDNLLSTSSSLGKHVLKDHTLKLGRQTSKLAMQSSDAHIFRKGELYKDISCNSGKLGMEAKSNKFAGQNSFMLDAQAGTKPSTVSTLAFGISGHSLVTCKCVQSSDVCVCDQRENELPRFVSTAFNRQTLLKPTALHSEVPDQNSVPIINSLITDDPNKSFSSLEMKRRTISKVSEKSHVVPGASATAILSKKSSENKHTDFMLAPKAENLNKAAHFSHANTSASLSAGSHAPTRQEQNTLSLLRSLRKQREVKVGQLLTGNFKSSGFSTSRSWIKEGNVKSVDGDSVSKEVNVPKAGKVSDSRKPSGAEQFLSPFGRGRGHSFIGSKFEGLKLSARNSLDVNVTSAITDLCMASPISSLYSEPVKKKQVQNKLDKQKVLKKSSQSNFEGLHILSRNSTQSFDSGETTVCNKKGANISKGHGRKNKQDVTEEKIISSQVDKDLNPSMAECQTKNISGVYDTNSNELSQNSAGGVHIIEIDGEVGKNSNYLSDILAKFRENNSVTKSTVIIIQNRSNKQERQNSLQVDEVVTCGTLGQPLGSQSCDSEQNFKENKVSPVKTANPVKTNNGSIKSYSLDLAADLAETENSSPSKKRKIEKEECEILKDLYQALNIPLSDARNAMEEIVSDVAADMDAFDLFGLSLEGCDENEEDNKAW